jgi:PAS domain-containing protein
MLFVYNNDTTFKYISPSITTLLGYTPEELIDYVNPSGSKYKLYDFISDKLNDYASTRYSLHYLQDLSRKMVLTSG